MRDYDYLFYDFNPDGTVRLTRYPCEEDGFGGKFAYYKYLEIEREDPDLLVLPSEIDGHPVTAIADYGVGFPNPMTYRTLVVPDTVVSIGQDAFCEEMTHIVLGRGLRAIAEGAFCDCEQMEKIDLAPDHPTFEMADGALYHRLEKTLVYRPAAGAEEVLSVRPGTRRIAAYALENSRALKQIILPDSVEEIGENAFEGCSARRITPQK